MSITSLDKVINTNFLAKLSRVSGGSKSSSLLGQSASSTSLSPQALYDSIRSGARNFAAGFQLLNASATFVNISLDTNEKLLDIVDDLQNLTKKANKGNISGTQAKKMRVEFDDLADTFDNLIEAATEGEQDFFDPKELEDVLVRAGLDKEKVTELAINLRKFVSPTEQNIDSDGNVTNTGNPVPLTEFKKALRTAIVDPDDPTDDKSGFFTKIGKTLQNLQLKLETNIKSLKDTASLIGENITLTRAAGFAFLDVSNEMTGLETPEALVADIQRRIRQDAATSLPQLKNLENIMIAGLATLLNK